MPKLQALVLLAATVLLFCPVYATSLWFEPGQRYYDYGDTLTYDLYADIDQNAGIYGFSFGLSFDNGTSYVTPGEQGKYLTFDHFDVGSLFTAAFFDDGDTISGDYMNPTDPSLSLTLTGTNILLGTFTFLAPDLTSGPLGIETIYLGLRPTQLPISPDQGLLSWPTEMPNNPTATAAPVPEPGTILLFGSGLLALASRRFKAKSLST